MKAEELRIGNLIVSEDDYIISVNEIYNHTQIKVTERWVSGSAIYRDYACNYPIYTYQPIILTEEWLKKFGFKIPGGGISYDKGKLSIYIGDTILSGKDGRTYFNSWAILEHSPKYVHELQNLYYALTKEELVLAVNPL